MARKSAFLGVFLYTVRHNSKGALKMTAVEMLCINAKKASLFLNTASSEEKNHALEAIADALSSRFEEIIECNRADVEAARSSGISDSMIDRLSLDKKRIDGMANGVREVASLDDPVGVVLSRNVRPNGLEIIKMSVPMGVIGIIYEARPNVTSDAAVLCLKAGSAVVLRGGKEALNSNRKIVEIMRSALKKVGFPEDCICLIDNTSRESATELMRMKGKVDLLIPRGGAGLIKSVVENATVPVIETGTGNCHVYVDESADLDMAANIVYNAKTSRVSVCNACESVLVNKNIAERFLPKMKTMTDKKNVELRGCEQTADILPGIKAASDDDYAREFLDYILSVKVVSDVDEAIEHINRYSSGHSECIVTENEQNAEKFRRLIDSAAVYVNASTRFTDGGEFGLGAEIGISTQKLHARGPMGLKEMTTYKYIINGNGQVR